MGSGDPSGLQNRRELALLALVSSTLTRFRQMIGLSWASVPLRANETPSLCAFATLNLPKNKQGCCNHTFMPPLIVHLDTEVFDAAELNLTGTKFKTLLEYCQDGRARLVMTSITKREITRHIEEQVTIAVTALKQASAEWWFIENLPQHKLYVVTEKPNKKELREAMATAFEGFLTQAKAEIISLSDANAEEIFDSYFDLAPPFSEGKKNRNSPTPSQFKRLNTGPKIAMKMSTPLVAIKTGRSLVPRRNDFYIYQR
jgi:hypothetical protein